MKKINIIITLILSLMLFGGCVNISNNEAEDTDFAYLMDMEDNNRNPSLYGTSLNNSLTDNQKSICSENGQVEILVGINNECSKAEYGFAVFVNGVRIPFCTNEDDNEKMLHVISMEEEERNRKITVTFSDEYIYVDEMNYVSIATILNPNFMIKSTEFVSFLPHHSLAAYNFYVVYKENGNSPVCLSADKLGKVYDLPEEINSMYMNRIGTEDDPNGTSEDVEYSNSLDKTSEFLFSLVGDFANLESCYACKKNEDLELQIACIGKSGAYRLSLYINNELVSAFDGCAYFDVEIERDKMKIIDVKVDSSVLEDLDEFNSIYLIAVPMEPSLDESLYIRPLKTTTRMLFVSDDEEKVNDVLTKYGYMGSDDEENIAETTAETTTETAIETTIETTTETAVETAIEATTEKVTETTTKKETTTPKETTTKSNETVSNVPTTAETTTKSKSSESSLSKTIRDVWSFEDGTVMVQLKNGKVHLYNSKNGTISSKSITAGYDSVQKLDNGIAVTDGFELTFKIYDCDLNLITEGQLPYDGMESEVAFAISGDGKSIIYVVNEGKKGKNVYVDSINLDSKKKVCKLSDIGTVGDVCWIDVFYAFDGETALFYGSYTMKSSSFTNELGNCFGIITTSGNIENVNYSNGFETSFNKGGTLVVGEVDEFDGKVETWTLSKGFKKITLKTTEESYCAMVSENFKFIATQVYSASEDKVTVKIYDISSMKQLYKKTFSASGKLKIDFSESQSCAYIVGGTKIVKAEL